MTDPNVHAFRTLSHPFPTIVHHVDFNNDAYVEFSAMLAGDDQYAGMTLAQSDDLVVYCSDMAARDNLHEILDELGFAHSDEPV